MHGAHGHLSSSVYVVRNLDSQRKQPQQLCYSDTDEEIVILYVQKVNA